LYCALNNMRLTLPPQLMDIKNRALKNSLHSLLFRRSGWVLAPLLLIACSDGAEDPAGENDETMNSGGSVASGGATASGGAPGAGGALASGGTPATGGALTTGGVAGVGGAPVGSGGGTGGDGLSTGGASDGTGGEAPVDLSTFAAELHELFLDRPCEEGVTLPQPNGAVCLHRNPLHVEEELTFGGEPGTTYSVTLRVRGIWEPTNIEGGTVPNPDIPYMVGGNVPTPTGNDSDAINYQQFYIEVGSPAQTYWLNEHNYVAHDIHKEDYEITIPIEGGSTVTVIANDGNEREIANFPEEIFADMPPYDQMPTAGQFLRLDVIDVEIAP
jgi:hypothetical protein